MADPVDRSTLPDIESVELNEFASSFTWLSLEQRQKEAQPLQKTAVLVAKDTSPASLGGHLLRSPD
jgi:hypothetical protein